jgi:hypothetical protein
MKEGSTSLLKQRSKKLFLHCCVSVATPVQKPEAQHKRSFFASFCSQKEGLTS